MNSVEKVKAICKEKRIPISRLERDLGFSNGYIGQLRKGTFPGNRLIEIAKYLDVSYEYLCGIEEKKSIADFALMDVNLHLFDANKKSPAPEGTEQIPGYSNLSETNKAIVDTMIAQLLAAQSDQQ